MNNIDILEEFLDYYSFLKTAIGGDDIREFEIKISKNEITAISNLIAENKELKKDKEEISEEQMKQFYKDAQKALKEYRETQNKVAKLEEENKELKEKVKAYETECRRFKAFCKKIRKDEKHDVDLFNQGQEQKCNEFLNLIEGEQHWNYEGKYFDETDKQIEDMKQSLLRKE